MKKIAGDRREFLWALALTTVAASACASSGGIPKPFPHPNDRTADRAVLPAVSDVSTLIETALALRGAPYRNGGADPNGFDCSGFTQYVFARFGVALARETRDQYKQGVNVGRRDLVPGDLLFFSTTARGASHVAIALGNDEFVHAPSNEGVVRVERLSARYWRRRFVGVRRLFRQP